MNDNNCPNIGICRLVTTTGFLGDEDRRRSFIETYCTDGEEKWSACKRYIVKNKLGFCPDFVLPDTDLTLDQIIDKFDEIID
ncbi:MAG: hypothetical protein KDC05_13300 [Bacteroidales bacterium]|nr:hypothetical protein [Bacteroidales bacterium]